MPSFTSTELFDALPIADGNRTGTVNNSIDAACTIEQHTVATSFQRPKRFSSCQVDACSDAPSSDWICIAPASRGSRVRSAPSRLLRSHAGRSLRSPAGRSRHSGRIIEHTVQHNPPGRCEACTHSRMRAILLESKVRVEQRVWEMTQRALSPQQGRCSPSTRLLCGVDNPKPRTGNARPVILTNSSKFGELT